MRRFISCAVTFGLAFSLFGIPGVGFADSVESKGSFSSQSEVGGSSRSGADAANADGAGGAVGSAINLDDYKDDDGNIIQITGQVQLSSIASSDASADADASSDGAAASSSATDAGKAEFEASVIGLSHSAVSASATESNEIAGSLLTVSLCTYKSLPASQSAPSLKATLKANGFEREAGFASSGTGDKTFVADLSATERVPAGDYTLEVAGAGYATYSQAITIADGNRVSVKLGDNQEDIFLESYGLIPYGDFDGDGKVTNADVSVFAKAIAAGSTAAEFDINGDSVVDVSDLQLFAASLKEGSAACSNDEAIIESAKAQENVRKDASGATVGKGAIGMTLKVAREVTGSDGEATSQEWGEGEANFEALLRNALLDDSDSTVVLGTGTDNPVASDNPVSIEVSTASSGGGSGGSEGEGQGSGATNIPMEGMTISYPTASVVEGSSAPAAGIVEIEDADGGATSYTFGGASEPQAASYSVEAEDVDSNADAAGAGAVSANADADADALEGEDVSQTASRAVSRAAASSVEVDEANGLITVDFGTRIAVKKIKITITAATDPAATLVEIGSVEFLNSMDDLIAPPDLSVPSGIKAVPGAKRIDVDWTQQANVSGYEIRFEMDGKTVSHTTPNPSFSLCEWPYSTMKDVKAGVYSIKVRSVKGEWTSPWSDVVTCQVEASEKPDRPTAIEVKAGYKELVVSWPAVDDADRYNLYYKEVGAAKYIAYSGEIKGTTVTIKNLKPDTEYTLYLTASNAFGTSAASDSRTGTPYGDSSVKVPWYNLINRQVEFPGNSSYPNPIVSVELDNGSKLEGSDAVESAADGRYDTGFIFGNQNGGLMFTFDKEYNMSSLAITTSLSSQYGFGSDGIASAAVIVVADDGSRTEYSLANGKLTKTSAGVDVPNTYYYTFPATKAKKVILQQGRYYNDNLAIAEVAFYEDDGLRGQLDALWADGLHTTLAEGVGESQIAAVESAIKAAVDSTSGEYTPKRKLYLEEVDEARNVLNNIGTFRRARYYDSSIDNSVNGSVVGGLNGWQPLGVSACEGEELTVFVSGTNGNNEHCSVGSPTALKLWICQYNSESENVVKELAASLKIGSNTVVVPNNISSLDAEHGGQIYVEYDSVYKDQKYGVRVLGGSEIAVLDLHGVTDADERLQLCKQYVEELDAQCASKSERHAQHALQVGNRAYADDTCIANTTDIVMDDMMYSVPASQILASIQGSSVEERAANLDRSLASMELMMKLFYQHKGLTDDRGGVDSYGTDNGIPGGHLNMRCMRMKDGVFMYAGGNHIGIPFGSCDLAGCAGVVFDENGKWQSGSLFGWGIAHEIGHEINQPQYTIAEVTNNYYAQLITNVDGNSRYEDQELYDRVTSGTYSPLSGRVGIGCYWQLHLAYDNYYNFKTFDTYKEQMENLVFARMDAYARNPKAAPKGESKQIDLVLDGCDTNDALARLACAATQRDLTDYFDAWGLVLNAATKEYASQFPEETRPIQYINDAAQDYRISGAGSSVADSITVSVEMSVDGKKVTEQKTVSSREVTLKISQSSENVSGLIGYEILRNGRAVSFQKIEGNAGLDASGVLTYTDTIATENNCTYTYSVRAIDKTLAATKAVELPQIKVSDDGTLADKSRWSASTNMVSSADESYDYSSGSVDADAPGSCEGELKKSAVAAVIDGDPSTGYEGSLPENGSVSDGSGASVENEAPYIQVDFGGEKQITAIKVPSDDAAAIKSSRVAISTNGVDWEFISKGTQVDNAEGNTATFYFDGVLGGGQVDPQLKVDTASSIRIVAGMSSDEKSGSLELHEIDVLGVTGDNVDFLEGNAAVGTLESSIKYADETGVAEGSYTIPAGSLVFIGSYKGDTAYNALKMFDQDGNLIPGTQVLFAERPGEGSHLGETADGRWIWYMTAEDIEQYKSIYGGDMFTSVHVSLYRVDDAETLANERHVADTLDLTFDMEAAGNNKITIQMGSDYKDFKTGDEVSGSSGTGSAGAGDDDAE